MSTKEKVCWSLSEFVEAANNNCQDFIRNSGSQEVKKCSEIHECFSKAIFNFIDPDPNAPIFFFGRAHAAFLGAVTMCTSYEVPEAYMVLRGVLENALYGFFVAENPEQVKVWLNRESNRQAVRDNFKIGSMKKLLRDRHPELGQVVDELYEQTIDYGAHPNQLATTSNTEYTKKDGKHHFEMQYLCGDTQSFRVCLKTVPAVGLAVLSVFERIYPERFKTMDLSERIEELKKGT